MQQHLQSTRCLCNQIVSALSLPDSIIRCTNWACRGLFHKACMRISPSSPGYPLFECPSCTLSRSDPLHQVIKVLVPPFIIDNQKRDFLIDQTLLENIRAYENLCVEIRSIKLEDKTHDQCWPNYGDLYYNQMRQLEFRPLQQNSALKKRKDEKFNTRQVKFGINSVLITAIKPDPKIKKVEETCVAAIYVVKKLTCEELVKKIKQENRRSVEDCKKRIIREFKNSGLDIDKFSYPLTCVFDMQLLKTPAKGAHCKHINCFSLENFVSAWQKNSQRKWNCPICKLKAYDIVVDACFEQILKQLNASSFDDVTKVNVEIRKDATYSFVKDEDNEEIGAQEKEGNAKGPEKNTSIVILDDSEEEMGNDSHLPVPDLECCNSGSVANIQSPEGNSIMQIEPLNLQPASNKNNTLKSQALNVIESLPINEILKTPSTDTRMAEEQIVEQLRIPPLQPVMASALSPTTFNWPSSFIKPNTPGKSQSIFTSQQYQNGQVSLSQKNMIPLLNPVGNGDKGIAFFPPGNKLSQVGSFEPLNLTYEQFESLLSKKLLSGPAFKRIKTPEQPMAYCDYMIGLTEQLKQLMKENEAEKPGGEKAVAGSDSGKRSLTKTGFEENKTGQEQVPKKMASSDLKMKTERIIQRLTQFYDVKLELPKFENFKNKRLVKADVNQDAAFQRSKKLLSLVMKQVPIYAHKEQEKRSILSSLDETGRPSRESSINLAQFLSPESNNIGGSVLQPEQEIEAQMQPQLQSSNLGNAVDPICLD